VTRRGRPRKVDSEANQALLEAKKKKEAKAEAKALLKLEKLESKASKQKKAESIEAKRSPKKEKKVAVKPVQEKPELGGRGRGRPPKSALNNEASESEKQMPMGSPKKTDRSDSAEKSKSEAQPKAIVTVANKRALIVNISLGKPDCKKLSPGSIMDSKDKAALAAKNLLGKKRVIPNVKPTMQAIQKIQKTERAVTRASISPEKNRKK